MIHGKKTWISGKNTKTRYLRILRILAREYVAICIMAAIVVITVYVEQFKFVG